MKKLIAFDLDGTLLDTAEDLLVCANETFDKYGYKRVDKKRVQAANGKDAHSYMRLLIGDVSYEEIERIWPYYINLILTKGADKTQLFEGLEQVLFELKNKGYILTILTNKSPEEMPIFIDKILHKLPFDEIQAVGGGEDAKPSPKSILALLEKYGIEKQNAFIVGDGEPDIITAINAGINSIGVLWGNRSKEQLAQVGATTFASKPSELLDILG